MYKGFFKRGIDFILALLGILFLSPILIGVTIALFWANKGKPFFYQARPGKNGRIFHIVKFKTMNDDEDENGNLLPDEKRLTWMGSIVRKTSIDEIPQLFNVIKGDMSLIGPRPLLVRYLPYYTQEEQLRHTVKPGITGWAQIKGRNTLQWDKRLAYDVWYVKNCSLKLDIQIILLTAKKVFFRKDIVMAPSSFMKDLDEERKVQHG